MQYNTAVIRKLLIEAFSSGDLEGFCYDYFHEVYEDFANQNKKKQVQLLIEYAERNESFEDLLAKIKVENPEKYAKFEPQILWQKPEEEPEEEPSKCGKLIPKLCNRNDQMLKFWRFFVKAANDCPTRPQFYFIHGDEGEGHESFITRMIEEHIEKYAQDQCGKEKAAVCPIPFQWPDRGDLEDRKYRLTMGTAMKLKEGFAKSECTISDLQELCPKNQFVALCYYVDVSKWGKTDEDLLRWYMGWAGLECDGDIPRFLIFFSMESPPSRFFRMMTAIKKMLGCCHFSKARLEKLIGDVAAAQCPCLPGLQLTPITKSDLEDWFRNYKHCINKKDLRSILKRCKNKNAEFIEAELETIIEHHNKELGNL